MTFCTAHQPPREPKPQAAVPAPRIERRRYRKDIRRVTPDQIFTDWASI